MPRRASSVQPGLLDLGGLALSDDALWVDPSGRDRRSKGKEYFNPLQTIGAAVEYASPGDTIILGPGQYDESVVIPVGKNLTIVCPSGRGSAYIEPETADAEGMLVLADDVTLINVGVAGESGADYALQVGNADVSPARFRAYRSKIEGPSALLVLKGAGDVLLEDCELCWGDSAILFDDNLEGFCTQVAIRKSRFHNIVTVGVGVADGGLVKNLTLEDCIFDNAEDATAPTDYILLSSNDNTGFIVGNRFATATNDTAVLTIGSGLIWGPNATEAGWSTARPS